MCLREGGIYIYRDSTSHHGLTQALVNEEVPLQPINAVQKELESRVSVGIAVRKLHNTQKVRRNRHRVQHVFT